MSDEQEETGYRAWSVVNPLTNPRLAAMCKAFTWSAKDVMEGNVPGRGDTYGFYSYKTPEGVLAAGHYPSKGRGPIVMGQIKILGKTLTGSRASRTNWAQVHSIYDDSQEMPELCEVCKREPGSLFVSIGSRNETIQLCPTCARKIKSILGKGKMSEGMPRTQLLKNLADYYQVPLVELSSDLKKALKNYR